MHVLSKFMLFNLGFSIISIHSDQLTALLKVSSFFHQNLYIHDAINQEKIFQVLPVHQA
jgi:hypothetical protein